MQISENVSLRPYNTFGIDVIARRMGTFTNVEDLSALASPGTLILGGGSNILFYR